MPETADMLFALPLIVRRTINRENINPRPAVMTKVSTLHESGVQILNLGKVMRKSNIVLLITQVQIFGQPFLSVLLQYLVIGTRHV